MPGRHEFMLGWTVSSHFLNRYGQMYYKKILFYSISLSLFITLSSLSFFFFSLSTPHFNFSVHLSFFFLSLEPPPLPFSCFFFLFCPFFSFLSLSLHLLYLFLFLFFTCHSPSVFFFSSNTEHTNTYIKLLPSPLFSTHAPPWSRLLTSCGSRAVQRWWKLELRPWEIQRLERGLGET